MLIKALGTYHVKLLNGKSFWTRPDETYCVVERTNTRVYAMSNIPGKPVFSANTENKGVRWDFVHDAGYEEWRSWFPIKPTVLVPIDMVLHCPACSKQHVDEEDRCPECPGGRCMCVRQAERWTNPPHRSHLCHFCGYIWRPADVPTNGVEEIQTKGKNDSKPIFR